MGRDGQRDVPAGLQLRRPARRRVSTICSTSSSCVLAESVSVLPSASSSGCPCPTTIRCSRPAPTVLLLRRSMRMKPPVSRLILIGIEGDRAVQAQVAHADLVELERLAALCSSVFTFTWYLMSVIVAVTVGADLEQVGRPGSSGSSCIHTSVHLELVGHARPAPRRSRSRRRARCRSRRRGSA
jgi:hypothetical protein